MRAFIVEGAGRTLPPTATVRETAPGGLAHRLFTRVRGALVFTLAAATVVATIIAARILIWAAGHPDQPFFRDVLKLFG